MVKNTIEESTFYRRDHKEDLDSSMARLVDKKEFLSDSEENIHTAGTEYRYLYTKDNELQCYDVYENRFVDIPN